MHGSNRTCHETLHIEFHNHKQNICSGIAIRILPANFLTDQCLLLQLSLLKNVPHFRAIWCAPPHPPTLWQLQGPTLQGKQGVQIGNLEATSVIVNIIRIFVTVRIALLRYLNMLTYFVTYVSVNNIHSLKKHCSFNRFVQNKLAMFSFLLSSFN